MIGCSVVRRLVGIIFVSVLLALALTGIALAGGGRGSVVQATDPSAASPAGVVYSIPLDSARQDASPHGHGGAVSGPGGAGPGGGGGSGGGSGGGAGSSGSSGTSSGSSGTSSGSSSASSGSSGASSSGGSGSSLVARHNHDTAPVLVPGGQPGSLVNSSNGFGSSSSVPGVSASASTGLGSIQSNASSAPLLALLLAAVVLLLGGYAGLRAWRAASQA